MSDDNSDLDTSLSYEQQLEKCNLQIVTCSTTSNYFHVLRRQLRRDYRKPLINFNSKKLLKFKGVNYLFYPGQQTNRRHSRRKGVLARHWWWDCRSKESKESFDLQRTILLWAQDQERGAKSRCTLIFLFRTSLSSESNKSRLSLINTWGRQSKSMTRMFRLNGFKKNMRIMVLGVISTPDCRKSSTRR